MYRIFIDSSVLISAALSSKGASFELLQMSENRIIEVIISDEIIKECISVIDRKLPKIRGDMVSLIKKSKLSIVSLKKSPLIKKAKKWISDANDAHVLAGATKAKVDFLVTLDIRDFIWDKSVAKKSGLAITTPGDFMSEFRATIPLDLAL